MHEMDETEAEAERLAPYPKIEPSLAGMTGFFVAATILGAFTGLADIELQGRTYVAFCVVAACGFGGPFVYFNGQKRRHFRVWTQLRKRDAQGA